MDEARIRGAAEALCQLLRSKLADPDRKAVDLERDEAILALGLIEGVLEILIWTLRVRTPPGTEREHLDTHDLIVLLFTAVASPAR
jgi:hypothetical protein